MIQIFGHQKCKGTRAAERFFKDRSIKVQSVDLKVKGLSKGELTSVANAVGGLKALFDATGTRAKDKGLHVSAPSEARLLELLMNDPQLLKTPIVRDGSQASVGEAPASWKAFADRARAG